MVRVIVDGTPVDVAPGSSALQACEAAGKEIPASAIMNAFP